MPLGAVELSELVQREEPEVEVDLRLVRNPQQGLVERRRRLVAISLAGARDPDVIPREPLEPTEDGRVPAAGPLRLREGRDRRFGHLQEKLLAADGLQHRRTLAPLSARQPEPGAAGDEAEPTQDLRRRLQRAAL